VSEQISTLAGKGGLFEIPRRSAEVSASRRRKSLNTRAFRWERLLLPFTAELQMKIALVALLLLISMALVAGFWARSQPTPVASPGGADTTSAPPSHSHTGLQDFAVKGRVPAYFTTAPDLATLPAILSPELFTGNQRLAYQAAKEIPQVMAQLPCYCHCDRGHGHKSLHSCFESEHGVNCGICIGEALMAYNLHKKGERVTEIRKQIIAAYGEQ
jgi:hypothetical protein